MNSKHFLTVLLLIGATFGINNRAAIAQENSEKAVSEKENTEVDLAQTKVKPRRENHIVRLSSDGFITGQISVLNPVINDVVVVKDVIVQFIQNGKVLGQVRPGVDGVFQAPGLSPGIYSLVVSSPIAFSAMGIQVVDSTPSVGEDLVQVNSLAVPAADLPILIQLVETYTPASFLASARTLPAPEIPISETPIDDPSLPHHKDLAKTGIERQLVQIDADGNLKGRIRILSLDNPTLIQLDRMKVFLLRGNSIVAQSNVNAAGSFEFLKVQPGFNSFTAVGPAGFVAFGIETSMDEGLAELEVNGQILMPVSYVQEGQFFLDGALISPEDLAIALRNLLASNELATLGLAPAVAPGGVPGVGGGVGGGGAAAGGDGGLLTGLIGGAIAGGLIAATQDDDNNTVITTTTTTGP